jgi:hypothetical protein
MSDIEKKPEQSVDAEQPADQFDDLPPKEITDKDAETIKGGDTSITANNARFKYTTQ